MLSNTDERWLKTADAAYCLGISQGYLKRCRDSHGGPLRAETHYILGPSKTSPIRWNIELVKKEFHYRGKIARDAEAVLQELQEVG